MMKEPVFRGVATAIVTPFLQQEIDYDAYDRLVLRQLEAQIPAIVVCGTTGEAATLSKDEKCLLIQHTARLVDHRSLIIAGVGTNSTEASVASARLAAESGADALLAVTPYYNKCTQEGLVKHYEAIADATALPLLLYNVPSRTGVNLLPETCAILSRHPRINGVKEASGSIAQAIRIRRQCGRRLHLWSGNDDQTVATMSIGGEGVISVLSNLCPKTVHAMTDACQVGNWPPLLRFRQNVCP